MTERPILFGAPMVRALLDGRKTQTRRIVKPQPEWLPEVTSTRRTDALFWPIGALGQQCGSPLLRCPYGVPGDTLWVREAWHYINHQNGPRGLEVCVGYPADGESLPNRPSHLVTEPERWADKVDAWPFKHRRWPGIHMPRWASRITLRATEVRVERLQDISAADAIAEGLIWDRALEAWTAVDGPNWPRRVDPVQSYAGLWNHINGPDAWAANPWVWAVSFERAE